jgi:hypothetical protein
VGSLPGARGEAAAQRMPHTTSFTRAACIVGPFPEFGVVTPQAPVRQEVASSVGRTGYVTRSNVQSTRAVRSRRALAMTDTLDRLIAAAASIGDSSSPVNGYRTPAAIGMPSVL